MGTLGLLLLIPIIWPFVAKVLWKHEITLLEMAANLAIGMLFATLAFFGSRYLQAQDVEVHNGRLLSKASKIVSCEHSYPCNCRQVCSGSGNSRSCTQVCDTCYEHSHDVDWLLDTQVGTIEVPRVDRQGLKEPARFTKAKPGDAVSLAKAYQNYIKAAPHSLFNKATEMSLLAQFEGRLPNYPSQVRDLHYVDRVVLHGVPLKNRAQWNTALQEMLADLGPRHEVNAVLVFTKEADPQYAEALRAHWLGGKKNDVVAVIGTAENAIQWVRVFSWTDKELFKVQLRDDLAQLPELAVEPLIAVLRDHIKQGFVRKSMQDFEYLKNEIEPPLWLTILLGLMAAAVSVGVSISFARNASYSR